MVGRWEYHARGQANLDDSRQIHLVNYPNARHWTAIAPISGTSGRPPVPAAARLAIPDRPELGVSAIARLADNAQGNVDIRHADRRGGMSVGDGHVADMRPFDDEEQIEYTVMNWPASADDAVNSKHPMSGRAVIPQNLFTTKNANKVEERYGRPIQKNAFVDGSGKRLAEWEKAVDGDYLITSMDGKVIGRVRDMDGKGKWKQVVLREDD